MEKLKLNYTAIGSLPFKNPDAVEKSLKIVFNDFCSIPFWAQLPHFKREEDMIFQYTQGLIGLKLEGDKYFLTQEDEEFFIELENLYFDYENVITSNDLLDCEQILDKYAISNPNSSVIDKFTQELKDKSPDYIKGSITGPFTFTTSVCDETGKAVYYNELLREICLKTLSLKALWQVKEFKKVSPNAKAIIFMDEPSISQVGSVAYLSVENPDVVSMLKLISDDLKKFGALTGVHCCGSADWRIAFDSNIDIVNFDAFLYATSIAKYPNEIKNFFQKGGMLAFGIVPTLDKACLKAIDLKGLEEKFEEAVEIFVQKGIDKKELLNHTFLTPSCGCAILDDTSAIKALSLLKDFSNLLKEKYKETL